jgi:hypothetical protein
MNRISPGDSGAVLQEAPDLSTQRDTIRVLERTHPLKPGGSGHLPDRRWFTEWQLATGFSDDSPPSSDALPLTPIDNSAVWEKIRAQVDPQLHSDYEILPTAVWERLISWYGGGPAIAIVLAGLPEGGVDVDFERISFTAIYL